MAKVEGKYNCFAEILNADYTFTGNDRDASFSPTGDDQRLVLNCTENPLLYFPRQYDTGLIYNNKLFIKRARIISRGAPGLCSKRMTAAELELYIKVFGGDRLTPSKGLYFVHWNEWQDVNVVFDCYDEPIDKTKFNSFLSFALDHSKSYFYVDDYNIQSAYIGQKFRPQLELEITTTGMYCTNSTHTVKRVF